MILLISHSLITSGQDAASPDKKIEIRTVPDSVAGKMKKDKDFLYANDMSYWKEEPRKQNLFDRMLIALSRSTALKYILYALLAAGILFALYQVMVVNNFFILSRGRRKKKNEDGSEEDTATINLDENISEAISQGNYRHAIRFMYLKTLRVLSDNNLITLHAKSTNQDYIRQMYKHNNLSQFRQLTRIYEYVWYGEFDPTESQFEMIRTNFNRFNQNS